MDLSVQITLDCQQPHAQAAWWASTLDWVVEPSDPEFIKRMIAQGQATDEDTTVYAGELVWKTAAAICPADQLGAIPRQRMLFQWVPEEKTVKNRMHLDLHTGRDKEEVRTELVKRGARFLYEESQGPFSWFTMKDPEGNEFCIS